MSAVPLREPPFEELVTQEVSQARQGAVVVVEARGLPSARMRWLERQLETSLQRGVVLQAAESLVLVVVPGVGPAETWLTVERLRRQLANNGWERAVVGFATWPVQGSSPMDVVAAALASLFDEHARIEAELAQEELHLDLQEHGGFRFASAGDLLSG